MAAVYFGQGRSRRASAAEVAAHASTPLLETAYPRLVPLDTLATSSPSGVTHVTFTRAGA